MVIDGLMTIGHAIIIISHLHMNIAHHQPYTGVYSTLDVRFVESCD